MKITRGLPLGANWKRVLRYAHSIRWTAAVLFFAVCETVLPLYQDLLTRGGFAVAAALAAVGSILSRLKDQPEVRDGHQ